MTSEKKKPKDQRYYQIQNELAEARWRGDMKAEIRLLKEQNQYDRPGHEDFVG